MLVGADTPEVWLAIELSPLICAAPLSVLSCFPYFFDSVPLLPFV